MLKWLLLLPGLSFALVANAQVPASEVETANLREDVRGLSQRLADLTLRVEQLETENNKLSAQATSAGQALVTTLQLNEKLAEITHNLQAAVDTSKQETLQTVAEQMAKLARETNAAIDSLAKSQGARPPPAATFSGDFPKEGVNYVVQKGDTLALIAKKTGAKVADIINANKLTDPSHIQAGQTLFVPGGK